MSSQLVNERAFLGNALHAPRRGDLELLRDTLIVIDRDGRIASVHTQPSPARERLVQRLTADHALVRLRADQYLLQGLVDLHIHAPQWPQLGKALDVPLEVWLQRHTFPLESRYADLAYAEGVWRSMIEGLLANGTTTALYFATIHLPASQRLAELCLDYGQRALVGR